MPLEGVSILKVVPNVLLGGVLMLAGGYADASSRFPMVDAVLPEKLSGEDMSGGTNVFFVTGELSRALDEEAMTLRIDTGAAAVLDSGDFFLLDNVFSSKEGH